LINSLKINHLKDKHIDVNYKTKNNETNSILYISNLISYKCPIVKRIKNFGIEIPDLKDYNNKIGNQKYKEKISECLRQYVIALCMEKIDQEIEFTKVISNHPDDFIKCKIEKKDSGNYPEIITIGDLNVQAFVQKQTGYYLCDTIKICKQKDVDEQWTLMFDCLNKELLKCDEEKIKHLIEILSFKGK
jgi:hypothetical protein